MCRLKDNRAVTVCSNAAGIALISLVSHFSAKEKKSIQVNQPNLIKVYNENMGGVDRMNQSISKYRIAVRGKKVCMHCDALY